MPPAQLADTAQTPARTRAQTPAETGATPPPRPRRTQADRRAATRGALLEATLSSLNEVGYARLTTSDVAARAGVTRGAQAHYFATKAELVVEATRFLVERMLAELAAKPLRTPDGHRAQYELLLNRMWEVHAGQTATALLELFVAARTDAELRTHLVRSERLLQSRLRETAVAVVPELADEPGFGPMMVTAMATIRGIWLLRTTLSEAHVRRLWNASRAQLVASIPAG